MFIKHFVVPDNLISAACKLVKTYLNFNVFPLLLQLIEVKVSGVQT